MALIDVLKRTREWFLLGDSDLGKRRDLGDLYPHLRDRIHFSDSVGSRFDRNTTGPSLYSRSIWLSRCVDVWKTLLSTLPPVQVCRVDDNEPSSKYEYLNQMFRYPNENTSSCFFWEQWAVDMALNGEHFVEVVYDKKGRLLELRQHNRDDVSVIVKKEERLLGKVLRYDIANTFDQHTIEYSLHPYQMIHFKFHDPVNKYRGLSPIRALLYTIMTDLKGREYNYQIFSNFGRPDAIALVPQGVTEPEKKALEQKFRDDYGLDSFGVGKVLVLEDGLVDFKPWNLSTTDLAWLDLLKLGREEIGAAYGLPPEFLGFGNNTYNNLDRAELLVYTQKIIPLAKARDDVLTLFFREIGEFGDKYYIKTDLTGVEALRRLYSTSYQQAHMAFQMGVPFAEINKRFKLGFEHFAGDDISHPFGTGDSIDSDGSIVGDSEKTDKVEVSDDS